VTAPQVGGGQREKGDALERPMGDILPGSDSQDTILANLMSELKPSNLNDRSMGTSDSQDTLLVYLDVRPKP